MINVVLIYHHNGKRCDLGGTLFKVVLFRVPSNRNDLQKYLVEGHGKLLSVNQNTFVNYFAFFCSDFLRKFFFQHQSFFFTITNVMTKMTKVSIWKQFYPTDPPIYHSARGVFVHSMVDWIDNWRLSFCRSSKFHMDNLVGLILSVALFVSTFTCVCMHACARDERHCFAVHSLALTIN